MASHLLGHLLRTSPASDAAQECLWLLASDGILVTLTGPVQKYSAQVNDLAAMPAKALSQDEMNDGYVGRELVGWDIARGAALWRLAEAHIDPSKLAAARGRLYFYARRSYAACLDLKSGKQLWKTVAPIAPPQGVGMGYIGGHATVKNGSIYRQGAVLTEDVSFITYLPHRQCQAFDAADGRLRWERMRGRKPDEPARDPGAQATAIY